MNKKIIAVFLLVFFGIFSIVSCKSPPPPVEEPPQVEEPPPPPPPPPPPSDPDGPELNVSLSPQFFSPDGDGDADELFVTIDCKGGSPIKTWKIEIREPRPPYLIFSEWEGEGAPPETIVWNGYSSSNELVQSASDYPFTIVVEDELGKIASYEGKIEVDVLVIREGDILRVMVPSIVFGSNVGGFTGLSEEVLATNDYILKRIAEVLQKFDTYNVTIEGHANFTATTEAARRREQDRELKPLSEQRAKFVLDYLVDLGVERDRLTSIGIGGDRPVVSFEDRDNWWKNRRVEFILDK